MLLSEDIQVKAIYTIVVTGIGHLHVDWEQVGVLESWAVLLLVKQDDLSFPGVTGRTRRWR